MNEYKYHITEEDFIKANKYVQQKRVWISTGLAIIITWLVLFVLKSDPVSLIAGAIATILALILFSAGIPVLQGISYKKIYCKNPTLQYEQKVLITEKGIHFSSKIGEANYEYNDLVRIVSREDMFLVFPTTQIFHLIPKNVLDNTSIEVLETNSIK